MCCEEIMNIKRVWDRAIAAKKKRSKNRREKHVCKTHRGKEQNGKD